MPIYARKKSGEYSTAPEGLWPAVCCDVIDLGVVTTQWGAKDMCKITWMLEERDPQTGKRYLVSNRYTLSLHEKSRLRPMLEAWRGKKFTEEELQGFDIEKLLGASCQLQVIHSLSNQGGTFANVQAVVPSQKGTPKVMVDPEYVRWADRPENQTGPDVQSGQSATEDDDCPF